MPEPELEKLSAYTNVQLRRDVVNKAIIRAMNKYFGAIFKLSIVTKGRGKDVVYDTLHSHVLKCIVNNKFKPFYKLKTGQRDLSGKCC